MQQKHVDQVRSSGLAGAIRPVCALHSACNHTGYRHCGAGHHAIQAVNALAAFYRAGPAAQAELTDSPRNLWPRDLKAFASGVPGLELYANADASDDGPETQEACVLPAVSLIHLD